MADAIFVPNTDILISLSREISRDNNDNSTLAEEKRHKKSLTSFTY